MRRKSWIAVMIACVLVLTAGLSMMVLADSDDSGYSGGPGSSYSYSGSSYSVPGYSWSDSDSGQSDPTSTIQPPPSQIVESGEDSGSGQDESSYPGEDSPVESIPEQSEGEEDPEDPEDQPDPDDPDEWDEYEVLEGDGATWTEGDGDLTFHVDGPYGDFLGIRIDGSNDRLSLDYYEEAEGSTIVSLKSNYVATLSVSTHTVDFDYINGSSSATFTVTQKSASPEESSSEEAAPTAAPSSGSQTAPKAGDGTLIALGAALIAMLALAFISWRRSRATKE